ncbi:MAG: hypothetical protein GY927_13250 [bacterium]|nr:hypothetical protein [bacterium]
MKLLSLMISAGVTMMFLMAFVGNNIAEAANTKRSPRVVTMHPIIVGKTDFPLPNSLRVPGYAKGHERILRYHHRGGPPEDFWSNLEKGCKRRRCKK